MTHWSSKSQTSRLNQLLKFDDYVLPYLYYIPIIIWLLNDLKSWLDVLFIYVFMHLMCLKFISQNEKKKITLFNMNFENNVLL